MVTRVLTVEVMFFGFRLLANGHSRESLLVGYLYR